MMMDLPAFLFMCSIELGNLHKMLTYLPLPEICDVFASMKEFDRFLRDCQYFLNSGPLPPTLNDIYDSFPYNRMKLSWDHRAANFFILPGIML